MGSLRPVNVRVSCGDCADSHTQIRSNEYTRVGVEVRRQNGGGLGMVSSKLIQGTLWSIVLTLLLSACSQSLVTPEPIRKSQSTDVNRGALGLCAGGLEAGIAAAAEAELQRRGGKITVGFQKYVRGLIFSRSDIDSSDKQKMYERYIDCILELDSRERIQKKTAEGRCELRRESCIREKQAGFDACIEDGRRRCISECMDDYGNSFNACATEYCNANNAANIAHWHQKLCRSEHRSLRRCESSYRGCLD